VLEAARALAVDAVVHGGDVFFRSRVPGRVVDRAYALFHAACEDGPPLFIVPGNHERSRLPRSLFLHHPRLHVFDRPRTFVVRAHGQRVALSGFPFVRAARAEVPTLARDLLAAAPAADRHLLCLHQAVEGAAVGGSRVGDMPSRDFVFRDRPDTLATRDLPRLAAGARRYDALLAGHIHRRQVLWPRVGAGRLPVCFPGSVERTSPAERDEPKGYFVVTLPEAGALTPACFRFRRLPTRWVV